jgi:hypothetical protein
LKQFALKESTAIHIASADFTPRKSGKRKVPSVRLVVEMLVANTALDQIWPGLRHQMYEPADMGELPGIEPASDTPKLRFESLKPIKTTDELTGYKATLDLGLGRKESQVELTGCKIDKFAADLRQGGSVALSFRISSEGLTERTIGRIGMIVDCDTALLLEPPTITDPLTGIDSPPGKKPENTKADVAEDARHRKAGRESKVARVAKKVSAAAKKAAKV